jgi:hypothetical protein
MIVRFLKRKHVQRTYLTYNFQVLDFQNIISNKEPSVEFQKKSTSFSYGMFSSFGMVEGISKKIAETASKSTNEILNYLNSSYFHIKETFPNQIFILDEIDFANLKTTYSKMNFKIKYQTESDFRGTIEATIDYDGKKLEILELIVFDEKNNQIYSEKPNYFVLLE